MEQQTPPEREFDQAQAYPLLEQIVADTVADLPDFPGFYERDYMKEEDCSHLGEAYEGWVAVEIYYLFSVEDGATDLVHKQYTELLRQQWTEAGYDIHRDTIDPDTGDGSLEAERPDGINLWWSVAKGVSLTLQTGCIPSTEGFDKPEFIPPAGGVPLENDWAAEKMNPPADDSSAAIDPFATGSSSPTDE